ncbi:MAG: Modulator of FtsH protease HflK [Gammaproteobacteria bacterium]|nr:Modulator of FtsH protease HflK [Gammaproteobacteria bacterium]
MSWNQPGPGGNDPWGQKGGRSGPPDLDEIVRNIQKTLRGFFGGRGGGGSGGGGTSFPGKAGLGAIVVVAIVVWALTGFYVVEEGTRGVVLRFGEYKETTLPGLQWRIPWPVEEVNSVNIQQVNTVEIGYRTTAQRQEQPVPREALMLTRDENIVDINLAVQYDIKDPEDLIFNVADRPQAVVHGATESALREVVGTNKMDFVLTEGRATVVSETSALLQQVLDRYQTGINIIAVEMQDAQPPREVKPAFDDAVKAREDQVRLINEAEAYRNDIIPRARGRAAREIQEAEGYKEAIIARAEGEASRFEQILAEYRQAPNITRQRMYIEKMEQVLMKSSKLMIDQKGGNNVIYLPLDQLLRQRRSESGSVSAPPVSSSSLSGDRATADARDSRSRLNLRERGE